jgi:hypothetical protein
MTMTFDDLLARVSGGEQLDQATLDELAGTADILPLGMLADAMRRRLHGTTVTYLRVARGAHDQSFADAVEPAAREVRITGSPETLAIASSAVASAKAIAGDRVVAGFSWLDVERLGQADGSSSAHVLEQLRSAGLEALAELPLDRIGNLPAAIEQLTANGFEQLRLTIAAAPAAERLRLLRDAADMQTRFACIGALNPLPSTLDPLRPTTGYEDVKTVALARLTAYNIPAVQVDWLRYGPKLAQVALTFGADDLDQVLASDAAPDGRRRAPLEELRRNVEAAGFDPVERDGRFQLLNR